MATQRKRKRARIDVVGDVRVEERIPRWEAERLIAALARIASSEPTPDAEVDDARR